MIPDKLASLVNEHCRGGFLLFYYDANGEPKLCSNVDSAQDENSLRQLVQDFLDSGKQQPIIIYNHQEDDDEDLDEGEMLK